MKERIIHRFGALIISFTLVFISTQGCDGLFPLQTKPSVPSDHTDNLGGALHKPDARETDDCKVCHGSDLKGGVAEFNGANVFANSCFQCHGDLWNRGGQKLKVIVK